MSQSDYGSPQAMQLHMYNTWKPFSNPKQVYLHMRPPLPTTTPRLSVLLICTIRLTHRGLLWRIRDYFFDARIFWFLFFLGGSPGGEKKKKIWWRDWGSNRGEGIRSLWIKILLFLSKMRTWHSWDDSESPSGGVWQCLLEHNQVIQPYLSLIIYNFVTISSSSVVPFCTCNTWTLAKICRVRLGLYCTIRCQSRV